MEPPTVSASAHESLAASYLLVPDDMEALSRVINVPPRKIGMATQAALRLQASESTMRMCMRRAQTWCNTRMRMVLSHTRHVCNAPLPPGE